MGSANYTYSPTAGGALTASTEPVAISAPSASAQFGLGSDLGAFLRQALTEQYERKKRLQELADVQRAQAQPFIDEQNRAAREAFSRARTAPAPYAPPVMGQSTENPQLKALRDAAEAEQLRTMISGPPLKLTNVGMAPAFYSPDTTNMSAIQRRAYLPQNSQMLQRRMSQTFSPSGAFSRTTEE